MEINDEIHDIKLSLARIETSIAGDEKNGVKGLAARTKSLEDYKKKDQRLKYKIAGGLFVSVPFLDAFWEFLKEWIKLK